MNALACLCLTLSACALTPEPVIEYRTVPIEVERLVPVPGALTRALDPPDLDVRTWGDCPVLVIHYRHRWESCETRMREIRDIQENKEP